jgi:hypothetical protein
MVLEQGDHVGAGGVHADHLDIPPFGMLADMLDPFGVDFQGGELGAAGSEPAGDGPLAGPDFDDPVSRGERHILGDLANHPFVHQEVLAELPSGPPIVLQIGGFAPSKALIATPAAAGLPPSMHRLLSHYFLPIPQPGFEGAEVGGRRICDPFRPLATVRPI